MSRSEESVPFTASKQGSRTDLDPDEQQANGAPLSPSVGSKKKSTKARVGEILRQPSDAIRILDEIKQRKEQARLVKEEQRARKEIEFLQELQRKHQQIQDIIKKDKGGSRSPSSGPLPFSRSIKSSQPGGLGDDSPQSTISLASLSKEPSISPTSKRLLRIQSQNARKPGVRDHVDETFAWCRYDFEMQSQMTRLLADVPESGEPSASSSLRPGNAAEGRQHLHKNHSDPLMRLRTVPSLSRAFLAALPSRTSSNAGVGLATISSQVSYRSDAGRTPLAVDGQAEEGEAGGAAGASGSSRRSLTDRQTSSRGSSLNGGRGTSPGPASPGLAVLDRAVWAKQQDLLSQYKREINRLPSSKKQIVPSKPGARPEFGSS